VDRALAPGRRFRPEIEGLRAVAAVLVAVYHVFTTRVSGGVDVFFVIAGLLVTTTLLTHVEGAGRVEAGRYLSRLGARLLPLAILTLIAVAIATFLWMPATREPDTYQQIAASALYVENWALALRAVDYTARDAAASPVQQFWAVSVQGQFYLLWLVLVAAVLKLGGRERFRSWFGVALVVVFAASLAVSIWLTAANQPFAYFHTLARAWEFAAGGLLVLALPRIARYLHRDGATIAPAVATAGGWLGLAILLGTGVTIRVATQFPGWVALVPVTAAILVLIGSEPGRRWGVDRLLGSAPFVFVGGVAYALYLWHWPVLVFYRILRRGHIGPVAGIGILALSFVLAVVTTRMLEKPIRTRLTASPRAWRVAGSGVAATLVVALGATGLAYATTPPSPRASLDAREYPGAAALADGFVATGFDVPYEPRPAVAARDVTALHDGACLTGVREAKPASCIKGDPNGDITVVLAGGSHATHWFPALDLIAKERGWRIVTALKTGCRLTTGPYLDGDEGRSCREWNRAVLEDMIEEAPDLLITTATVTSPTAEWVPDGYLETWAKLEAAGIPIVGIRDTPRSATDMPDCLAAHPDRPDACDLTRVLLPRAEAPAVASLPSSMTFVDMTEFLCTTTTCPSVVGNVAVYRDRHHLTASYARTLAPMLAAQLPDPEPRER
jgi:peptidoglycan/LPS O-acetylase OafA/YrhL